MRRAVLSLIPSLTLATLALILGFSDRWDIVGVPVDSRNFGDLDVILRAAQCAGSDSSWTPSSQPCQEEMSHYNYPAIWAKTLGLFGADSTWTPSVAIIIMFIFALSLIPLTWLALGGQRQIVTVAVMTMTCLTPPVWLGFQRANTDLFIFSLISLAIFLWLHQSAKSAAAVLGVATSLKIFPIGAALMLLTPQFLRLRALVTFGAVLGVGAFILFKDLGTITGRTPQVDGASFGAGVLPLLAQNQLSLASNSASFRLIGWATFIVIYLIMNFTYRYWKWTRLGRAWTGLLSDISIDRASTSLVLAGSGAFLVAYLLGPSFDYRLVLLIPVIAGLLRIASTSSYWIAGVLFLQMLLSYSLYIGRAEYLSDLLLLAVAPMTGIAITRIIRRTNP